MAVNRKEVKLAPLSESVRPLRVPEQQPHAMTLIDRVRFSAIRHKELKFM